MGCELHEHGDCSVLGAAGTLRNVNYAPNDVTYSMIHTILYKSLTCTEKLSVVI